jgi:hypothetical protein
MAAPQPRSADLKHPNANLTLRRLRKPRIHATLALWTSRPRGASSAYCSAVLDNHHPGATSDWLDDLITPISRVQLRITEASDNATFRVRPEGCSRRR